MKNLMKLFLIFGFMFILVGCQPRLYTIQFLDWDGTVLKESMQEAGEDVFAPNDPTREGYVFVEWLEVRDDKNYTIIITAQYEVANYTVTFKGFDGEILQEVSVLHNQAATPPEVSAPNGYDFVGWDTSFSQVTSDLEVLAEFEKESYLVRFFDDEGTLLKEQQVEFEEAATAPSVLDREVEEFSHWDTDFSSVTSALDITAVFKEKEYTVTFYDGDKTLSVGISSYKATENITLPTPVKAGYAFSGWFLSEISLLEVTEIGGDIKGNLKLYSRWVKTDQNEFSAPNNAVEFVQINKNPHSSGTGFVYQPQFPSSAVSTSVTQYNWASSDTRVATVSIYSSISIVSSGYAIITATHKTNTSVVYYCVIHTSADGVIKATLEEANAPNYVRATFWLSETETVEKLVQKGGFAVAPTAPIKDGYIFTGWSGENEESIYNITANTVFHPTYVLGENTYQGKTISVLGDSITTFSGYIPSGFAHFYPYPTADISDVNQTWWMQFINHYGMHLLVNNSWSGSAVAGNASSAARSMLRLQHLYIGDVKPDVILIFMGANDAPSPYITLSQFDQAYGEMITNIKSSSPDSEIILCTLPSIPLYTETAQDSYNAVIEKYASLHDLTVLDFASSFTRAESNTYLVDSAHPNKAGMDRLASTAISDFLAAKK